MVLPAIQHKDEFIDCLRSNRVVIVHGGTGCGKTTQLPLAAQQAFSGKVVCTQPRRAAAKSVAARVAEETRSHLGDYVGYGVRFDKKYTDSTEVVFATEGHLLQTLLPKFNSGAIEFNRFNGISVLFLDECHEHSKELEVLLFLAREILHPDHRPDFKVVLMSATPDVNALMAYFAEYEPCVMNIPGVYFPITISHKGDIDDDEHFKPVFSCLDAELVRLIMEHHNDAMQDGDFLVFMPGEHEIYSLATQVINAHQEQQQQQPHATRPIRVLPFHASQPHVEHNLVFEPFEEGRKVIIATNVAESSLTIANLTLVFDACEQKIKHFDFDDNAFELCKESACKNALKQRAGRVGRTSPGRVFRMCTDAEFEALQDFDIAAVTRVPIDDVFLKLLVCAPPKKIPRNTLTMDRFFHAPSPAAEQHAVMLLVDLGAIKCTPPAGEPQQLCHTVLTAKGRDMSHLPLPTTLAHALLSVRTLHGRLPLVKVAAMMSTTSPVFTIPRHDPRNPGLVKRAHTHIRHVFISGKSDHLTLFHVLQAYQKQPNDKHIRDDWCAQNFLNAHSLREAYSICHQLLDIMRVLRHEFDFPDITAYKSKTLFNDLTIALLEAYTENIAVRCLAATGAHQADVDRKQKGSQSVDQNVYWVVWSGQAVLLPRNSVANPSSFHQGMPSNSNDAIVTPPLVIFSELNKMGRNLLTMSNCSQVQAKHIKLSIRFDKALKKYGTNISPVVRERLIQEGVIANTHH
ncbi:P-loop containing nucleoside triphosphate hydrolase protein [Gongronella butleri]|nr:P-loop containing nucleoside triphosphate hydrolase protein [Gongronella butleri]